jgi:hypothetical protein
MTVTGEARGVGQAYRVAVHLHESAGTPATIVAIDLTFTTGTSATVSAHFDQPISDAANVCPANGSVDSRELVVVDADPSHAYATTAQARVSFTDNSTVIGTTTGSAAVPPLIPPPPQTFVLTGVITDAGTHAGIPGASLNVLAGPNAGKSATTDSSGTYVMRDLLADSFRLRASASDYDSGEQGVTVPTIPRADFILTKSCGYTLSPSSGLASFGPLTNAFTVTPNTANNCPWVATTPDSWIALIGPTTGTGSGSVGYSIKERGSATPRDGHIVVGWPNGTASFTLTQPAVTCPAPITVAVPASGGEGFVNVGASCYFSTTIAIDVPWIRIFGTMGGGTYLEPVFASNSSGVPRTGHITLTGDGLYLQITVNQAGS